jgi:hypothetical protein
MDGEGEESGLVKFGGIARSLRLCCFLYACVSSCWEGDGRREGLRRRGNSAEVLNNTGSR